MQLLVDTTQETPASLRFIAATLCQLADLMVPAEPPASSINGPSLPIVLHAHGPAAPIDPVPLAAPVIDPAQQDPAAVFGRANLYVGKIHENVIGVPMGTNFPQPAATLTQTAPPAPANLPESAPPAPMMTPATALSATVAPAAPSAVAPAAVNDTLTPPTPSTGLVVTAGAVDKNGMAWDAKVHSESKALNADGTWRFRRNLDAAVKAAYLASIAGAAPLIPVAPMAPAAPPAPEASPAPTAPVAPQPPVPGMGAETAVPVPDGVSLGVPNAPQPPAVPAQALGFRDFMSAVNKALAAGRMTQDQLITACKAVNLDGITALAGEPMKISLVHSQIAHLLGAATA